MATWTNPITFVVNAVLSAAQLNANIRDNLLYLLQGRPCTVVNRTGSSDYTTTSTSFVDVDASNLIITQYSQSGRVKLTAIFGALAAVATDFDITVDGVRGGGSAGLLRQLGASDGGSSRPIAIVFIFTGLSVGNHTFKLQWKVDSGTGTIKNNASPIIMMAEEV